MDMENKVTKRFLKDMAPNEVLFYLDELKIPSPHKEILIAVCVFDKDGWEGVDFLEKEYHISIGYWSFVRRLKEALKKFRLAYSFYKA